MRMGDRSPTMDSQHPSARPHSPLNRSRSQQMRSFADAAWVSVPAGATSADYANGSFSHAPRRSLGSNTVWIRRWFVYVNNVPSF